MIEGTQKQNQNIFDKLLKSTNSNTRLLAYLLYILNFLCIIYIVFQHLYRIKINSDIDNQIQKLAKKILNFREYKYLIHEIWADLKRILGANNNSIFLLYKNAPEKDGLEVIYDDIDAGEQRIKIKKDFRSFSDKSTSVQIYEDKKNKKCVIIDVENDKENELFAGRNSQIYKPLTSSTQNRLGLISLQSRKEYLYGKRHADILDRVAKFFESAIETDNIFDGLKEIIINVGSNNSLENLVDKIYPSLIRIIGHPITLAIGIKTSEGVVKFIGKDDPNTPCSTSEDIKNNITDYPSFECIDKNKLVFAGSNSELEENYGIKNLPKELTTIQSFIYAPIGYNEKSVGLITLQSKNKDAFNQKYSDLVEIIASALTFYFTNKVFDIEPIMDKISRDIEGKPIQEIEKKLIEDDIKGAFDALLLISDSEEVKLLCSQYNLLEKHNRINVISFDDFFIKRNSIVSGLLRLVTSKKL